MKLFFEDKKKNENIKLGGGMELPYDNNYCIFIKNNITTIKKVNSKKDFKDCEYMYGTFIDVSDSIEGAKTKVSQFTGPAKNNKLNILTESKKRMNESERRFYLEIVDRLKEVLIEECRNEFISAIKSDQEEAFKKELADLFRMVVEDAFRAIRKESIGL